LFFFSIKFLLALQLESDEPEYDMDKIDHDWFNEFGRISCPNLTHLEYEIIIDKLENASTRTLISLDEARTLLPNIEDLHIKTVYEFWNERRTTRVYFLNLFSLSFVFNKEKKIEFNILDLNKSNILTIFFCIGRYIDRIFGFFFSSLSKLIRTND
jgi:hypothetical protein